jgi:hypothetical protein
MPEENDDPLRHVQTWQCNDAVSARFHVLVVRLCHQLPLPPRRLPPLTRALWTWRISLQALLAHEARKLRRRRLWRRQARRQARSTPGGEGADHDGVGDGDDDTSAMVADEPASASSDSESDDTFAALKKVINTSFGWVQYEMPAARLRPFAELDLSSRPNTLSSALSRRVAPTSPPLSGRRDAAPAAWKPERRERLPQAGEAAERQAAPVAAAGRRRRP